MSSSKAPAGLTHVGSRDAVCRMQILYCINAMCQRSSNEALRGRYIRQVAATSGK